MRAEEIREGDKLLHADGHVYVVESVTIQRPYVIATVRFNDGGRGERMWEIGKTVPLTRTD